MRKVLSTLLVLAMALTVFGGAAFAAEFNDMGVFPVVKDGEGIKLTVATPEVATITDYDNNHLTNYLRERMGIEIEVQLFDNAEYKTQLQLMTSSGARLPDLLLNFNLTPTEREFYGRQGYFIDLRPYFEEGVMTRYFEGEAGSYLTEAEKATTISAGLASNGALYGFPFWAVSVADPWSDGLLINNTFCEALGMDIPTTIDEYYEYLVAVKTQDPNGNGIADEIPLSSAKNRISNVRKCLMTPFVYTQNGYYLPAEDGTMGFAFTEEGWREGMRFVKRLIDEGLFDPAFLTQDITQLTATQCSAAGIETVGAVVNISTTNMSSSDIRRYEYVRLAALANTDGKRVAVWEPTMPSGGMLITKNCKDPELAFRLGDWLCSEEMSLYSRYGREGVDYHYWQEGDPVNDYAGLGKEQVFVYNPRASWGNLQNIYWALKGPSCITTRLFFGQVGAGKTDDSDLGRLKNANGKIDSGVLLESLDYIDVSKVVAKLIFNEEEQQVVTDVGMPIASYAEECRARFITGDMDLDSDWGGYLAELDRMGLEQYVEAVQSAYDRMNADK